MAGPIIPIPPIDLGGPQLDRYFRHQNVASSFLALSGDPAYDLVEADLRVSLPSGVISLSDGTIGGAPLSGILHGLPNGQMNGFSAPSGVEGDTLAAMMREFPRYTRVNWDKTSLGAQIFTAVSRLADELVEAGTMSTRARFPMTHPLYEQGVVYEYNYNDVHDLTVDSTFIADLQNDSFLIPMYKDEHSFWQAPPTRLETTSSEIDGLVIMDWTQVGASGLSILLSGVTPLPLHNQVMVEVSGARYFSFHVEDETEIQGMIYLRGTWAHEGFRHRPSHLERIPIFANAPIISRAMYSSLSSVEARGFDPYAYVRIRVLGFGATWKSDSLLGDWNQNKGEVEARVFWQLISASAPFNSAVQSEEHVTIGPSDQVYLARTRLLTDTIYDEDLEWDVLETWKLRDTEGNALSGIVDFAPVPNARYLLLLDSNSNVHVFDTYRPAIDMRGFPETAMAPARIQLSSPDSAQEIPENYTVQLDTKIGSTADGVQRWRWAVHHHGGIDIIPASGVPYPFHHLSGWQSGTDELVIIPKQSYVISGAGQYIFELALVTDTGTAFQTCAGFQQVEKTAINTLPIRGLTLTPSGIEFDSYGRPWVQVSGNAVRLVMRTDAAIVQLDQRTLITREPYDIVERYT